MHDVRTRPLVHSAQIVVLAKEPLAGRAKTRLTPPLLPRQAAAVAKACLLDTLAAVTGTAVLRRTVVLDGSPVGWLPPGLHVLAQRGGSLGERLAAAVTESFAAEPVPLLLIGMDTPQVTPRLLDSCLDTLLSPGTDAVLGHADDGGWWAIGLREPVRGLFDAVPMSTDRAGSAQASRLAELGLRTRTLPVLRDIDHIEDVTAVAAGLPRGSQVAALVGELSRLPELAWLTASDGPLPALTRTAGLSA